MFRLQDNVPEIYVNESRDFQLVCRMMDAVQGSTKYKIDSLIHTSNTKECNASLLQHLKYKLGFFDDVDLTDEQLRFVLMGFPYIVRYKGSKKAIEDTMNLYFRLMNIPVEKKDIDIDNVNYHIKIGFSSTPKDTKILDVLFKYILPTGYTVGYNFEAYYDKQTLLDFNQSVSYDFVTVSLQDKNNSLIHNLSDNSTTSVIGQGYVSYSDNSNGGL